jgi:hypothetical protein
MATNAEKAQGRAKIGEEAVSKLGASGFKGGRNAEAIAGFANIDATLALYYARSIGERTRRPEDVLLDQGGANLRAVRQRDRATQAGADLRLDAQVEVAVERLAERAATLAERVPGQLGFAQLPGRDARLAADGEAHASKARHRVRRQAWRQPSRRRCGTALSLM